MNLQFSFACHSIKEITEDRKFLMGRVSDYGEPARISGCLDYVTLTPKVAVKIPCIKSIVCQSSVLLTS